MKPAFLLLPLLLATCLPACAGHHIVVIDPGHGGRSDSGSQSARTLSSSNNATSPAGLQEKDLTLELSLEIKRTDQGHQCRGRQVPAGVVRPKPDPRLPLARRCRL